MTEATTDLVQQQELSPAQQMLRQVRSDEFMDQIKRALPGNVTPQRFVRAAYTALLQTPDLAAGDVDPDSIFQSLMKCATDGLLPDGREAALVVFKDNSGERSVKKAQYMPMIGGFRKIAGEDGWSIRTAVVYTNDQFEYELGLDPKLTHIPPRPGVDRGEKIGAYAVGSHKDGRKELIVLDGADVEKLRQVSRAKDRGPWRDWTDRMWEKSAGRQLFKKLPLRDRELVARIAAAGDIEPADAAAQLYGPEGAAALAAGDHVDLESGEIIPAGQPESDGTTTEPGDASQQAGAAAPQTPLAAAVPVPGEDDEEPLPPAAQIDEVARAKAAGVAATVVPSGAWAGQTLTQVLATGEDGEKWFQYVLRNPSKWDDSFVAAVEVFVKGTVQAEAA